MAYNLSMIQFDDEALGDLKTPASVTQFKEYMQLLIQNQNNMISLLSTQAAAAVRVGGVGGDEGGNS